MSNRDVMHFEDRFASLTEGLSPKDTFLKCWLSQVILRIRRELIWLWRDRTMVDRLTSILEKQSTAEQRVAFFAQNETARYLQEKLSTVKMPLRSRSGARGSLAWLARDLHLSRVELFVVALALAAAREADLGALIAALNGENRKQLPTIALAQLLWNDDPHAFQPLLSLSHPLFAHGILRRGESISDWDAPILMPAMVAQMLEGRLSHSLFDLEKIADEDTDDINLPNNRANDIGIELLASRMMQPIKGLHVVPVTGPFPAGALEARHVRCTLQAIVDRTERPIYTVKSNVMMTSTTLENAGLFCWFRGADLLLPAQGLPASPIWQNALRAFPIYVFAAESGDSDSIASRLPVLRVPSLSYNARYTRWKEELQKWELDATEDSIRECAFRFRFDETDIEQTVSALRASQVPLTLDRMLAACQQEISIQVGELAELVTPRFQRKDLVLSAECGSQFDQLLGAMQSLSRVHAEWGTGSAWDDAGIAALFAGPPGTGKTMAAEVLAAELNLPLYRVDLSQVVNKYIGETEKNLRKLFDAAEMADIVLFIDEAEVLLGQRITARQANDRFSNMEVAYLLQRMERFRGLAVLATNRKKDIDEAFLRRLRFFIEFPAPSETERREIWDKAIPSQVTRDGIDLDFLAHEFALTGGNIRSIVLNACLRTATETKKPSLTMKTLIAAIDREYEKLGRPLMNEQKTQWQSSTPSGEDWGWAVRRGVS